MTWSREVMWCAPWRGAGPESTGVLLAGRRPGGGPPRRRSRPWSARPCGPRRSGCTGWTRQRRGPAGWSGSPCKKAEKLTQPLLVWASVRTILALRMRAACCRTTRPSAPRRGRPRRTPRPRGRRGAPRWGRRGSTSVGLDASEELVGQPVREVEVVGSARVLAGVVTQLEELLDVGVPRLEVDAGRALAPAALVDRWTEESSVRSHGTMPLERPFVPRMRAPLPRTREKAMPMPPANFEAAPPAVALVDRVELVARRVDEVARAHLRVPGARVEQRRAARQVARPAIRR